jgi:DNA-binding MarR family transcriptional regulator
MLLRRPVLDAIRAGRISLVFRKWRRPTVKAGGSLKTALGVLAIQAVDKVTTISAADARRAGYDSRATLLAELAAQEGTLYRIGVAFAGEDPRIALRLSDKLNAADWAELSQHLARLDAGKAGPWVARVLALIGRNPETAAGLLADEIGWDKPAFKTRVRQLKERGLTESLDVGYRLTPRGRAVLRKLKG